MYCGKRVAPPWVLLATPLPHFPCNEIRNLDRIEYAPPPRFLSIKSLVRTLCNKTKCVRKECAIPVWFRTHSPTSNPPDETQIKLYFGIGRVQRCRHRRPRRRLADSLGLSALTFVVFSVVVSLSISLSSASELVLGDVHYRSG